jgi:NAD(P)-dependent dehydrogenase (short-subunit alcohol dehydrogenase family)
MTIEGKAVLVTGANRGIGKALVEEALRRGAKRVYAGTRQPLAKSDERIAPLTLDVTDTAQIQAAVESVESLDVLINGRMGDFDHAPSFTEGTKGVEIVPELAPSAGSRSSTRPGTARSSTPGSSRSSRPLASTP